MMLFQREFVETPNDSILSQTSYTCIACLGNVDSLAYKLSNAHSVLT